MKCKNCQGYKKYTQDLLNEKQEEVKRNLDLLRKNWELKERISYLEGKLREYLNE